MINNYIYGGNLQDTLTGTAANDYIDGGAGADIMTGLAGDDTYVVDNVGDIVNESAGGGTDTVNSYINYSIATDLNLENITLLGSAISATGNSGDNVLKGNSAVNTLIGGDGNDTYIVQNSNENVVELAGGGTDTVISTSDFGLNWAGRDFIENLTLADGNGAVVAVGNNLNNVITGNQGNNIINGKGGADTMIGGFGNDIYVVDDVNDTVVESSFSARFNNDADKVITFVNNYTLADNVEILDFRSANMTATGNSLDNTYIVSYANIVINEAVNGGTDTVNSSVSYTLTSGLENLTLTGTLAIDGTGNSGDNVLTGNSASNLLTGGDGNDTYYINSADYYGIGGDKVIEGSGAASGVDTIISTVSVGLDWYAPNVENLTLAGAAYIGVGDALNNVITGNDFANILNGKGGDDRLIGNGGADILFGDVGNDTFVFSSTLVPTRYGIDTVVDFTSGSDHIELSSAIFSNVVASSGTLAASDFAVIGSASDTGSQHILYNSTSGMLYYDADAGGAGSAIGFATIGNQAALISADFVVA